MATITWNALSNSTWNTATNWDSTSVPTASDDVYFNATSVKDCTVDIDASFSSLYIQSTYTGGIDAAGHSFTCGNNFWDEGTGSKSRRYGNAIRINGNTGRLNFGPSLGLVDASSCTVYMNGKTGCTLDCSKSITSFKRLVIDTSAVVTLNGTAPLYLEDTTCPLVIGSDSSLYMRYQTYIDLEGNGDYISIPSKYYWYSASAYMYFRGATNGTVNIPGMTVNNPGGAPTWTIDNQATDRTFNIGDTKNRGVSYVIRNSTASSNAIFNFNSDFSCASLNAGCTVYGARATYNFGSGGYNIPYGGFTSSSTYDKAAPGDCTYNFGSSKWFIYTNWLDGTASYKNIGTYKVTWGVNDGTFTMTTHKPFYDLATITRSAMLIKPTGDLTCHSLVLNAGHWSNDSSSVLCNGDASFLSTGTVNFGNNWVMSGSTGTFYLASTLSTRTATSCSLHMDGTTGMTLNIGASTTFKSLTLDTSSRVSLSGSGQLQLSDTTAMFTMGSDSTMTLNSGLWLNLEGQGSYMSLPAKYSIAGGGGFSFRGLATGIDTTVPAIRSTTSGNWGFDCFGVDRTYSINLVNASSSPVYVRNYTAGRATFNFKNDFTSAAISLGNAAASGTFIANFGSGSFDIRGNYTNDQYTTSTTGTFSFSTSKWYLRGNWTDSSAYTKDPGTSILNFNTNNATITTSGKSFYDITINQVGKDYSCIGDMTCHNLTVTNGNWSNSNYGVSSSNNVSFNGVGNFNFGNSYLMTGASGTLSIASTVGNVVADQCGLLFAGGTIGQLHDDTGCTFKSMGNSTTGVKWASNGAAMTHLRGTTNLLTIGNTCKFTQNAPLSLEVLNNNGVPVSFGQATAVWDGTGADVYFKTTSAGQTVSLCGGGFITYSGTGKVYLSPESDNEDGTFASGGYTLGFTNAPEVHMFTDKTNSSVYYYTGDTYNAPKAILRVGSSNPTSSFKMVFANSNVYVGGYDGTTYHDGSSYLDFGTLNWYATGNWSFGSHQTVIPNTATVTFQTNSANIISAGNAFPYTTFNQSGKTFTIVDDFTCLNFNCTAATLVTAAGVNVLVNGTASNSQWSCPVTLGPSFIFNCPNRVWVMSTASLSSTNTVMTFRGSNVTGSIAGVSFTIKKLVIDTSSSFTTTGSGTINCTDTTGALVMGQASTFTSGVSLVVNQTADGSMLSLPASYTFNSSNSVYFQLQNPITSYFQLNGSSVTGSTQISSNNGDATVQQTGFVKVGTYLVLSKSGRLTYNTNDNDTTALGYFRPGVSGGTSLTMNFGNSGWFVNYFAGDASNTAGTTINLENSRWNTTTGTTWIFGTNCVVNPGTSSVTFPGINTITSNGKSFWDVTCSGTGLKTFSGNLACHDFTAIQSPITSGNITASGNVGFWTNNAASYTVNGTITLTGYSKRYSVDSNGSSYLGANNVTFNGGGDATFFGNNASGSGIGALTVATGTNLVFIGRCYVGSTYNQIANPLNIGDSTFTLIVTPGGIFRVSTYTNGSIYSFGPNSRFDGSVATYISFMGSTGGSSSYGPLKWDGTGVTKFEASNCLTSLAGDINLGDQSFVFSPSTVHTNDYDITCGRLICCPNGGQNYFGNSVINCTLMDGSSINNYHFYMENSTWNVYGNWSFNRNSTTYFVYPGTSTVNFYADAIITSGWGGGNSRNFNDVTCDAPGHIIRTDDDFGCRTLRVIDGSWDTAGRLMTCLGNATFLGYGSVTLGTALILQASDATLAMANTLSTITANLTDLTYNVAGSVGLDLDKNVTFKSLNMTNNQGLAVYGDGITTFAKAGTPVAINTNCYLDLTSPVVIQTNASAPAITIGASFVARGPSVLYIDSTTANAAVTIPGITTLSPLDVHFISNSAVDNSRILTGGLTIGGDLHIHNAAAGGKLNFITQDYTISAGTISYGSDLAGGNFRATFGSSKINVTNDVNPTSFNGGTSSIYMYKSQWTVGRDWTCPSNHLIYHGWDTARFIGDGNIDSNGEYFNFVYFDASGHTINLVDDFVCRERVITPGTNVVQNGKFSMVPDRLLQVQSSKKS